MLRRPGARLGARLWAWLRDQAAFLVVVAVLGLAFGYLIVDPRRTGRASALITAAVLLAALLRAAVPTPNVGMLAVRGRVVDTACFLLLGALLVVVDIRLHE